MPYAPYDDAVVEMHRLMRAMDHHTLACARNGRLACATITPCPRPVRPLLTALVPHGMATVRRAGR